MTLNLTMPERAEIMPKITVFGVGGAGGNAVNNMIKKELVGVDFVVANTDAQALRQSTSTARIQMGLTVTEGLGAGAKPEVGAAAAEETIEEIVDHLAGSHLCFITAGMGGGTGTGAAPIIAQAARELDILTVGVVTKPFQFEGIARMRIAEDGVDLLQSMVDTLIVIPNQNLFRLANETTTFTEAFAMADDVLYQGVKGVTDLMVRPGLINLDFADVRTVMDEMGKAMMGSGEASGEDRAKQAAEKAIANPLLDEISLQGAKGVLINVTGGHDLTLFELDEAATMINSMVDKDAVIITGSTLDETMKDMMRVSIVATGIDAGEAQARHTHVRAQEPFDGSEAESMMHESEPLVSDPVPEFGTEVPAFAEMEAAVPEVHPAVRQMDLELPGGPGDAAQEDFGHQEGDSAIPSAAYRREPEPIRSLHTVGETASGPEIPGSVSRRPGVPSPETMERLRAAVAKRPEPLSSGPEGEAAEPQVRQRFRVNGLIDRMTKQREPAPPRGQTPRLHQPVQPADEQEARNAEHDRVGIPAFLRRQAN